MVIQSKSNSCEDRETAEIVCLRVYKDPLRFEIKCIITSEFNILSPYLFNIRHEFIHNTYSQAGIEV